MDKLPRWCFYLASALGATELVLFFDKLLPRVALYLNPTLDLTNVSVKYFIGDVAKQDSTVGLLLLILAVINTVAVVFILKYFQYKTK